MFLEEPVNVLYRNYKTLPINLLFKFAVGKLVYKYTHTIDELPISTRKLFNTKMSDNNCTI